MFAVLTSSDKGAAAAAPAAAPPASADHAAATFDLRALERLALVEDEAGDGSGAVPEGGGVGGALPALVPQPGDRAAVDPRVDRTRRARKRVDVGRAVLRKVGPAAPEQEHVALEKLLRRSGDPCMIPSIPTRSYLCVCSSVFYLYLCLSASAALPPRVSHATTNLLASTSLLRPPSPEVLILIFHCVVHDAVCRSVRPVLASRPEH
eukprot:140003-Pleurochrysis_carterae.AAC.2